MKEAVPKRDSSFFFISEKTGVGVQFHELWTMDGGPLAVDHFFNRPQSTIHCQFRYDYDLPLQLQSAVDRGLSTVVICLFFDFALELKR